MKAVTTMTSDKIIIKFNRKHKMTKSTRGGIRLGAGRPTVANKAKPHTINLTDAHWLKFKSLGGVKFLKQVLDAV